MSYEPCHTGIHICGADAADFEPITVFNWPVSDPKTAATIFNAAEDKFRAAPGEPDDLMVDLCQGGDIDVDFPMTRQMLEPLKRWLEEGA